MQYKILFSLLIFPAIILGMEDAEKMLQVRTMKEAQRFIGKMIAANQELN